MPRINRSQRPTHHVVRKGDWLSKIALRYGMSVQEVMSLNGLADDRIDIGSRLRLRGPATPVQAASEPLTEHPTAATKPSPTAPATAPDGKSAEALSSPQEKPEDGGEIGDTDGVETPRGLTARELIGGDKSEDENSAATGAMSSADVGIPTLSPASVNPLSRARLVLAAALVILGLLCLHPRTRALISDRLAGMKLRGVRTSSSEDCIEMHAVRRLGANQQLLFFEVAGTRLLVGASDGRMDLLHRWDDASAEGSVEQTQASTGAAVTTAAVGREAASTANTDPNSTTTRRSPAVEPEQPAKLTPSAEQLLDAWRHSVADQGSADTGAGEDSGWWLEGATRFERTRLSDDLAEAESEAPSHSGASAAGQQRDQVEESILETLRSRRSQVNGNVQAATRGSRSRPSPAHGGFRAAARLGRRTANDHDSATDKPAGSNERDKPRTGGNLSFQL